MENKNTNKKKRTRNTRMMPHSIEAEQSVLGCCLIDDNVPVQVMNKLKQDDYYTQAHQTIFEAMNKIYQENKPIDFVTLTDELERMGAMESVGGIDYITTLTNIVPSAANFMHYVNIVKRDSVLRNLIKASQNIIEKSYEYDEDGKDNVLGYAEKQVYDIAKDEEDSGLTHIGEPLNNVIAKFDKIAKDKHAFKGIPTGLKTLDKVTNGLQNSDLIFLAARPSVGKTSLAMNIVNYAAIQGKRNCAVFSLEMSKEQLAQRSLCGVSGVNMKKAIDGKLTPEDWQALWAGSKKLGEAQIFVDDSSLNTPIAILNKCRRLKREKGLDLIMIDYLQLMTGGKKAESRQNEVSELSRNLKVAARELNVPIIVLSQLSREVEKRQDHRPVLSDLRESGSIEQDADIVMFIHNPSKYNDVQVVDGENMCELIIAKHRNGQLATIKLKWIPEITTFLDCGFATEDGVEEEKVEKSASLTKMPEPVPPPPAPEEVTMEEVDINDIDDKF